MSLLATTALGGLFEFGRDLLGKLLPDPAQRAAAELELLKLQQSGELDAMRVKLSAIIAEASSADPYTSRARPSFLYVMYIMILMAVPVGIVQVFHPAAVATFTGGVQAWLSAIPEELWWLFGTGYLGYTASRTFDKRKGAAK